MKSIERQIAEAASDYKLAVENTMFAEEYGGIEKLREELFMLVSEFEMSETDLVEECSSIYQTKWAQDFLAEASSQFPLALQYAESCDHFLIIQSDELGPIKFAIVPPDNEDFWMAAYDTLEQTTKLCEEMGWRYTICE